MVNMLHNGVSGAEGVLAALLSATASPLPLLGVIAAACQCDLDAPVQRLGECQKHHAAVCEEVTHAVLLYCIVGEGRSGRGVDPGASACVGCPGAVLCATWRGVWCAGGRGGWVQQDAGELQRGEGLHGVLWLLCVEWDFSAGICGGWWGAGCGGGLAPGGAWAPGAAPMRSSTGGLVAMWAASELGATSARTRAQGGCCVRSADSTRNAIIYLSMEMQDHSRLDVIVAGVQLESVHCSTDPPSPVYPP